MFLICCQFLCLSNNSSNTESCDNWTNFNWIRGKFNFVKLYKTIKVSIIERRPLCALFVDSFICWYFDLFIWFRNSKLLIVGRCLWYSNEMTNGGHFWWAKENALGNMRNWFDFLWNKYDFEIRNFIILLPTNKLPFNWPSLGAYKYWRHVYAAAIRRYQRVFYIKT